MMTWMSYTSRAFSLLGILPLILKKFTPGDIVLWYMFSTFITLQTLADFGFRQTFSRLISFAFGGAESIDRIDLNSAKKAEGTPNMDLLSKIVSSMRYIYARLTVVLMISFSVFGTWSLLKPVEDASNERQAWISWIIFLIITSISFYGKLYLNFLEGTYKIALVRRIDTLTSLGSVLFSILVLLFSPSLLNLVIVNQTWVLIVAIRDWHLCFKIEDGLYSKLSRSLPFDKDFFKLVWQPAWRSGISFVMSLGLTNLTGIVYAQIADTSAVASYLLALRILNQIKDISMAPFFSKLSLMAIYRVKGDQKSLVEIIKRGMFLSHLVFVVGVVFVGVFSDNLMEIVHSKVPFVSQGLWLLLGIAFFINRYGSMHMYVYLSTNHVISHIADGVSGVIYIVFCVLLSKVMGVYSIPVAMIIGYLGFYSWYAAKYSYSSIEISFFKLEKTAILLPLLIMTFYSLYVLILQLR